MYLPSEFYLLHFRNKLYLFNRIHKATVSENCLQTITQYPSHTTYIHSRLFSEIFPVFRSEFQRTVNKIEKQFIELKDLRQIKENTIAIMVTISAGWVEKRWLGRKGHFHHLRMHCYVPDAVDKSCPISFS